MADVLLSLHNVKHLEYRKNETIIPSTNILRGQLRVHVLWVKHFGRICGLIDLMSEAAIIRLLIG